MNKAKAGFLQNEFLSILQTIPSNKKPAWGKMTLQQMIEHFSGSVRMASGKVVFTDILTPPERLQKLHDFLMSDAPFKKKIPSISYLPRCPPR